MHVETPSLTPDQIAHLSALVAEYITLQREKYVRRATVLPANLHLKFAGFFPPELLTDVRVLALIDERIANPDFYRTLIDMGFSNLPDQSAMVAVTFSNTVVSHGPPTDETLFHELVHVEQYRQLGVPEFSRLYVKGFLDAGGYLQIPLEQNAYSLCDRFQDDPGLVFSVKDDVAEWIAQGRF